MKLIKAPKARVLARSTKDRRVVAVCGDTQVGLWMMRSMAMNGLTVFSVCRSAKGQAAHSRYSSGAWAIERQPREDGFVDELLDLCREVDAGSIMTISEAYHDALIDARDRFEPDIHVFSPSRECFDKATDKDFMQKLCVELGIAVAAGMTLAELMAAGGDALQFPLVLRTSRQNVESPERRAPWKAAYAADRAQLAGLYESVGHLADNVIVQEYHCGVEDHVQVLMHNGEAFMVGDYIGEHHMPLAGGVTVQRVSCHHENLVNDAVRLLKAIRWQGIAGVQFHYDTDSGEYIFLEINPRFIGGLPTVIMAGFQAPFLLWQSHFEPDEMRPARYKPGLRTRILGGDANWMFAMMRGDQLPPGQKRLGKLSTMARFVWNCGPWTKDDSFMWRDPRPFCVDLKQMIKKFGSKSFDIIGNPQSQESRR